MSKIGDLITRMSEIPEKVKRATQLDGMIATRDKLKTLADRAEEIRDLCGALEIVDKAEFVTRAKQGLASASTNAAQFRSRLENGSAFDSSRADKSLTLINERLETAKTGIEKSWQALIQDEVAHYEPLADASERASLPGAPGLKAAITQLKQWQDQPPSTLQAANTYNDTAALLPTSIANLGLEGRAGKFIVDASKGQAKAKDLQNNDILVFLETYPMIWSMLRVSL